jgi:carbonic anhydrase
MRATLIIATFLAATTAFASEQTTTASLIAKLTSGNAREASAKPVHPHNSAARRSEVAKDQHPFAVVVGCSDSRVPPEVVFDQGLGDLFVVRTAGEVLDKPSMGSIEYGVEHLHAHLIVVLGHERCGAVKAAVEGGDVPPNIQSLIDAIRPAVDETKNMKGDTVDLAVRANVLRVVKEISADPALAHAIESGEVAVVGMYYDLDTGKATKITSIR